MQYRYEKFSLDHIDALKRLSNQVLGTRHSAEHLVHKYDQSSMGLPICATMAFHEDTPVGFYGVVLQRFSHEKGPILAAHACDSITLPTHQGRGIHFELAQLCYQFLQNSGVKFVYAFHSENTFHSTKKLGWETARRMVAMVVKTGALPMGQLATKMRSEKIVYNRCRSLFEPYLTTPRKNPVLEAGLYGQLYDPAFHTYKQMHPNFHLELEGTYFWIKLSSIAYVGCFQATSSDNFERGLNKLKTLLLRAGINKMIFQIDPNTGQDKLVGSDRPLTTSYRIGYKMFDPSINLDEFGFNYGDLDTF